MLKTLKFPTGFLWGVSTSAYQIEGNIKNDWSEWEKKNAKLLANKAHSNWQDWQQKKFPEMFEVNNYICGQACNSFKLFEKDLECLIKLNCNSYRLGIEWARVEPEKGKIDIEAIENYRRMLKLLKNNNIKVILTLWHWTNPLWLAEEGGWENKKVIEYFSNFTKLILNELGKMVDYWVILNEPLMVIGHGYLDGKFPPNKKFNWKLFKVLNNFIKVQKKIYKLIHEKYPDSQVGVAMTTGAFTAANNFNPIEKLMAVMANYFRNHWFVRRINNYSDYIGVNYYHHNRLIWYPPFKKNLYEKITDRGWEIYPEGLYTVLKDYKKYNKPILILENGIADADDKQRADFIKDHLLFVYRAIVEGVDVRGYFYWSLLDNFEWAEGYWPKFGLFAVDKNTFVRTSRSSVEVYAEICKNNGYKINL